MKLVVNGEEMETLGASLADLVAQLGARTDRVAVMVNGEVIAPPARDAVALKTGDRIEILTFAAGG